LCPFLEINSSFSSYGLFLDEFRPFTSGSRPFAAPLWSIFPRCFCFFCKKKPPPSDPTTPVLVPFKCVKGICVVLKAIFQIVTVFLFVFSFVSS